MAGGFDTNQPFVFNLKCIIISLIGIILFILPGYDLMQKYGWMSSIVMLFTIFVFIYVGIAYYDHLYDCQLELKQGKYSVTRTFKPIPINNSTYELLKQERNQLKSVYLFHILAIAPFLISVSWSAYKVGILRQIPNEYDKFSFYFVGILGLIAGIYHAVRFNYPRI